MNAQSLSICTTFTASHLLINRVDNKEYLPSKWCKNSLQVLIPAVPSVHSALLTGRFMVWLDLWDFAKWTYPRMGKYSSRHIVVIIGGKYQAAFARNNYHWAMRFTFIKRHQKTWKSWMGCYSFRLTDLDWQKYQITCGSLNCVTEKALHHTTRHSWMWVNMRQSAF